VESELELELKKLTVGTNDQRRRVGQALYHFYRTLIFWRDKGLSFHDVTRAWSAGGAAIFDALAATLREVGSPQEDAELRALLAEFLGQLADDLERGDHMLLPFLRWLEACFPRVTEMMRAEDADSRIYDIALADLLASLFVHAARAELSTLVGLLRATVGELSPSRDDG
jgi:hypothetical protein